jgi:hypothetical protein
MNIAITLDTEQQSALDDLLTDYNATQATPVSAETYLASVITGIVNDKVARNFEATANALVAAAKSLSYEARLALVANVQAQITP